MTKELNQFEKNNVWTLIPKVNEIPFIENKWILKNKLDDEGKIVKIKTKLLAQGYIQERESSMMKTMHQ